MPFEQVVTQEQVCEAFRIAGSVAGAAKRLGVDRKTARRHLQNSGALDKVAGDLNAVARNAMKHSHQSRASNKNRLNRSPAQVVAAAVMAATNEAGLSVMGASAGLVLTEVIDRQRRDIGQISASMNDLLLQIRELARPQLADDGTVLIDPTRVAQAVQLLEKATNTVDKLHTMQRDAYGIEKGGKLPTEQAGTVAQLAAGIRAKLAEQRELSASVVAEQAPEQVIAGQTNEPRTSHGDPTPYTPTPHPVAHPPGSANWVTPQSTPSPLLSPKPTDIEDEDEEKGHKGVLDSLSDDD